MPRNALGRGLGALIREPEPQTPASPAPSSAGAPAASQQAASSGSAAAAAPAMSPTPSGPLQIEIDLIDCSDSGEIFRDSPKFEDVLAGHRNFYLRTKD